MADKLIEGLWDCPYCGSKAIGGLTKHCPNCGHPQDQDIKFYMGQKKKYLEDDVAKEYGKGADWTCEYCGSLNRVHYKFCANCGGAKEEAVKDYFGNQLNGFKEAPKPQPIQTAKPKKKRSFLPLALIFILLGLVMFFVTRPKNAGVRVTDKDWIRSIDVEDLVTVQESDWSVPDGGRVYDKKNEIHHYDKVVDHYVTRSRQVSEKVYDGEDYHTSYKNNGDGTFTESTYSTPRYRTETHTEYYQDPVYRDEPVYRTKYYYDIDRWIVTRTETSYGKEEEPYWPELNTTGKERAAETYETYYFKAEDLKKNKSYEFAIPQSEWEKLEIGKEVEITYTNGRVTKINGVKIDE